MIRTLAPGEVDLARSVFGTALRTDTIRLFRLPLPFRRAFVPGALAGREWIGWPTATWAADLSQQSLRRQATLIHELVHIWQAQQGINLLIAKLRAGDGPSAYAYGCGPETHWANLNIEQQASVIEHRFLRAHGATVPGDMAFYTRVCPF
ncbi:hypothetical protein [Brevundimonas sp.]|uniref:hypothetical protein n=1 Tax=Brevundimonas sp. TaxID=1871086 RepID=UPI001DA1658E|nr:hypothetical protein [Brevundimonas sp.]MBL0947643.1 hypothetical protein [Brevundimonas sp.]